MSHPGVAPLCSELLHFTVDRLKITLKSINAHPLYRGRPTQKLSGLKSDLLGRITALIDSAGASCDATALTELHQIIQAAQYGRLYDAASSPTSTYNNPAAVAARQAQIVAQQKVQQDNARLYQQQLQARALQRAQGQGSQVYSPAVAAAYKPPALNALPAPRYNIQQVPTPPAGAASGSGANWSSARVEPVPIRFRKSPFYRIETSLSSITTCIRAGQGDRKTVTSSFALSEAQRVLLSDSAASPANKQYSVRLFSTNEEHFNPSRSSAAQNPVPIDFPGTVEVRLNNVIVTANLKGIKKQIGTAAPADLSSVKAGGGALALSLGPNQVNRIEINYSNTDKKYFLIVYFVEVTTVRQVVQKIKAAAYRSKETVIAGIVQQNSDPDVDASSFGLSLLDPVVMRRITLPVRSTACNHISCFDAEAFFMMNEQTPAWKCPICSKVLNVEDISVDGYFASILAACPSSTTSVTVEPDGTWRSADNLHGTAQPRPSRAGTEDSVNTLDKGKGRAVDQDILIDSDDDAPLMRKHPFAIKPDDSPRSNNSRSGTVARAEVIDLTLSDSDEYDAPPGPNGTTSPMGEATKPLNPPEHDRHSDDDYYMNEMMLAAGKRRSDDEEREAAKRRREGC